MGSARQVGCQHPHARRLDNFFGAGAFRAGLPSAWPHPGFAGDRMSAVIIKITIRDRFSVERRNRPHARSDHCGRQSFLPATYCWLSDTFGVASKFHPQTVL